MDPANSRAGPPGRTARFRLWTLLGLVVAFGWNYALHSHGGSIASAHTDLLSIAAEWSVVAILAVIGFGIQKRRPAFFGLRVPGWRDILIMLGLYVATYVVLAVVSRLFAIQTPQIDLRGLAALPFSLRLGIVLTAGICEEFMYRGFAIEQLGEWTGSVWLAALVSWLVFVLAHVGLYGLTTALVVPALAGGALTVLYVWRRNLPVCMLMHALFDGVSLLLMPALLHAHGG